MSLRTTLISFVPVALLACSGNAKNTTKPVSNKQPVQESKDHLATMDSGQVYATACAEKLAAAKKLLAPVIAKEARHTVDNTLHPYNELLRALSNINNNAGVHRSVDPDEKVRNAAAKCEQDSESFMNEVSRNRDVYNALAAVDTTNLDADAKRFLAHELRDFRRAGVDKDDKTRARLKAIDDELVKLTQQYAKNVVADVRHIQVSQAELAGLPADYIKAHKPDAQGRYTITTNYPDYQPFMSYADSTEARRKLYMKFRSRGDKDNKSVLRKVIELRHEKANLLGYKSWADYATETRMMKTAKRAAAFIDRMVKLSTKRAKKDYAELLAYKRKSHPKAKVVADYEKVYLENKVKAADYAFDVQSVRPYFSYERVEKGLLAITSRMYDIQYVKVDAKVWHDSVKVFDVMRGSTKLGRIYLDMHPRDGKYKHAAEFGLVDGVEGRQLPEGVLVCNFPDPKKGTALMEHNQVETMFHEFGHLMHHIFGGHKTWITQSGTSTELDFVEAPSQMFEEWAWSYDTLSTFAKHYKTGDVIPKQLVAKMRKARAFGVGVFVRQQMYYASISLDFYRMDPAKLNMAKHVAELNKRITPFPYVEGTAMHLNFGHLMGYSANYYTYMWSLVIAKDMLTPFKRYGLMDTEWTHKYRDKILVPGGSKDAADLVKDFLGRPFNFKAFEKFVNGKS